jgi:hypothetical protein
MATCETCKQSVKESVVEGRKLIAQVYKGHDAPKNVGRYLTILHLTCSCGVRVERRYENRPA